MKTPKRIELNQDEMQELIRRIKGHKLKDEDYEIIEGMAGDHNLLKPPGTAKEKVNRPAFTHALWRTHREIEECL